MALQNVRLCAVYKGFLFGSNGINIGPNQNFYIDASRRKFVLERAGGKFRFACDVVVAETSQSTFASQCQALEDALDSTNRNGGFFLASDTVTYANLDKVSTAYFQISAFGSITNGKVFTITANGTAFNFFANSGFGTTFVVTTSNLQTAKNLATAINGSSASTNVTAIVVNQANGAFVYLQSKQPTYSITVTTNATGASTSPSTSTAATPTGFNARTSIRKAGSPDDTALSRRYEVEIVLDLPHKEANRNGLRDSRVELVETDSRQKLLRFSGTYTSLAVSGTGGRTALEQYDADVDTHADGLLKAFTATSTGTGAAWEGPFDLKADLNDDYAFPTDASRKLGTILTFSRVYQELLYVRGLSDDVRLRRASLVVSPVMEAPGDYGPNGKAVFRMRSIVVRYDTAVDKTATQDLKGIYSTVVKPFLADEARKQLEGEQVALVRESRDLDKTKNRIRCEHEFLAALGGLVESTVSTTDEDDAGAQLVAVWNGDDYGKQDYDGPKTFRRTVVQSYTILSTPAGAAGGTGNKQASDGFGVFSINGPRSFLLIQEVSAKEQAIDDFFFGSLATGSSTKIVGGENDFPTSGGVPEPKGFKRKYRNGSITITPVDIGRPGSSQIKAVVVVKSKTYEYFHAVPTPAGGPTRTPSPGAGGGNGPKIATGGPGGALS